MFVDAITSIQLLRYAIVGMASNTLLFLAYLLITEWGIGHKTTMTILYVAGVSMTFVLNRNWTFTHHGHVTKSFITYVLIYASGYVINLITLYLLVDKYGFRHQWVQGFMIVILAVLLFMLQKFIVFRKT